MSYQPPCLSSTSTSLYLKYEINIYWSNKYGHYIAEVPELPSCMSDGKTYEETLKNIKIIMEEWLETATEQGIPIPVPKEKGKRGGVMYFGRAVDNRPYDRRFAAIYTGRGLPGLRIFPLLPQQRQHVTLPLVRL
jgi:predicted RNase H-like HicB family nuclease